MLGSLYIYMKRKGEDSWLEVEPNKDGVQEVVHLIVNDHIDQMPSGCEARRKN